MAKPQPTNPRIQVKKDGHRCYIQINGVETPMTAFLAKEVGEALFKAGCDVATKQENKKQT
jgi:hypothetical protein